MLYSVTEHVFYLGGRVMSSSELQLLVVIRAAPDADAVIALIHCCLNLLDAQITDLIVNPVYLPGTVENALKGFLLLQ